MLLFAYCFFFILYVFPATPDDCYDYMDESDPGSDAEQIYPDIFYRRASSREHLDGLINKSRDESGKERIERFSVICFHPQSKPESEKGIFREMGELPDKVLRHVSPAENKFKKRRHDSGEIAVRA